MIEFICESISMGIAWLITIAIIIAITWLISVSYDYGEKVGRCEGFVSGWYFLHKKDGRAQVPDNLLEKIVPLPCTSDFGNLVDPSAIGSERIKAFFKWMVNENPKIGRGLAFHEYANRRIDLNELLEYIEQRKKVK